MEPEIAAALRNNVKPTNLKWLVAAALGKYLRSDGNYRGVLPKMGTIFEMRSAMISKFINTELSSCVGTLSSFPLFFHAQQHTPAMSSRKNLALQRSDGQTFELEESVETMCSNLRNMIGDKVDCASSGRTILVPGVDGKTLATVIEQCKKHANCEHGSRRSGRRSRAVLLGIFGQR
ncbi:hypothetical protein RHSIM_Rhsim09G0148500 [Rhododendron simsii]|uniref:SKP1 component POZ domain-containing protein n=1 Tax=Rhododendron simsii TaxID=118357 RepID=A0A834GGS6_RHOSS|nr:hypothetical protein RHSIM_Rhsim09G0148500 [Rhododendron simsii]